MDDEWTSLRIRKATLVRLKQEAKALANGRAVRVLDNRGQVREGILNMDTALSLILARVESHRERSKKSRS